MLNVLDLSPLTDIASQYPLVLDIISYMWLNASTSDTEVQTVQQCIDRVIPALIIVFKNTDAVTFINFLGPLLPKLEQAVSSPSLLYMEGAN